MMSSYRDRFYAIDISANFEFYLMIFSEIFFDLTQKIIFADKKCIP